MKASTVTVQLNQRDAARLDLQSTTILTVAVRRNWCPRGVDHPSPTSAPEASLLELDQTAFKPSHQLDLHAPGNLCRIPGLKMSRREDYMAGRWGQTDILRRFSPSPISWRMLRPIYAERTPVRGIMSSPILCHIPERGQGRSGFIL
jgi:hypothetical protein